MSKILSPEKWREIEHYFEVIYSRRTDLIVMETFKWAWVATKTQQENFVEELRAARKLWGEGWEEQLSEYHSSSEEKKHLMLGKIKCVQSRKQDMALKGQLKLMGFMT